MVTKSLVLQCTYGHMWGTVGSGLTPGSLQGRKKSGKTVSGSGNPEKPKNLNIEKFQNIENFLKIENFQKLENFQNIEKFCWIRLDPRITPG